ncbi:unnamed protein product [Gadus morhua 'NCC']
MSQTQPEPAPDSNKKQQDHTPPSRQIDSLSSQLREATGFDSLRSGDPGAQKNINRAELRVIPADVRAEPTPTIRIPRAPAGPQQRGDGRRGMPLAEESDDEEIIVMEPATSLEAVEGIFPIDRPGPRPDRGQTAPDQGQTPDEPADRALRKDLSQVTGNTRTRLRGLRELWAETRTIALLDQEEEKPLGRPSGLNPVPGQTAPDRVQTAPDQGQTAPDQVQTDQKEKPLGRPSGLNPLGDIKTATQQAEGKGLRPWMHVL